MQEFRSNIIAGLYLTQLMCRLQLHEASSDMGTVEMAEFEKTLETGELSQANHEIVNDALNSALAALVEQFGALQATRLTRGLYKPGILKVIIQQIMSRAGEVDWKEIGEAIPRVAEQYKIDKLINPMMERPLGIYHPDYVRQKLNDSIRLLDLACNGYYRSTDADYRYARIWANQFQDPATLIKGLYEAGVQTRDDEENSQAVENLMGGDSGEFEAFCIYHSLGLEMAQAWEDERVHYGHDNYKGALRRAKGYSQVSECESLFASAIAAGYPAHDQEKEREKFAELILKIPGYIHDEERELVNNLIISTAPLLYLEITDEARHKSYVWRGIRVSADYRQTMQELENSVEGSGWMPLVRLRTSKFANRNFDTSHQGIPALPSNSEKLVEHGRVNTNQHPSTMRITYLVDRLCEIIEQDFYDKGYFN